MRTMHPHDEARLLNEGKLTSAEKALEAATAHGFRADDVWRLSIRVAAERAAQRRREVMARRAEALGTKGARRFADATRSEA